MKEQTAKTHTGHKPHPAPAKSESKSPTEPPAHTAPIDEAAGPAGEARAPEKDTSQELANLQDRFLRLQADFDNFRKRNLRERAEIVQRAHEQILLDLLPVIDHFEMGLAIAQQHHSDPDVMEGFHLVYDQMVGLLKKFNLTPLEVVGQTFDPHLHDATAHIPSDEFPEHAIISQVRRGYRLDDRVIRHAQVVVSSGPAGSPTLSEKESESGTAGETPIEPDHP